MKRLIKKYMPNLYSKIVIIYSEILNEIDYKYLKNTNPKKYQEITAKRYQLKTGKKIDFNNLETYTEKMQYAKLFLSTPLKTKLADKYKVRNWVSEKIGDEYLIPLLGVWNSYSEID